MRARRWSAAFAAAVVAVGTGALASPSDGTSAEHGRAAGPAPTTPAPMPLPGRSRSAVPRGLGFDRVGRGFASWAPEFPEVRCRTARRDACPRGHIAWFTPSRGWRAGPSLPQNVVAHALGVGAGGRAALVELLDVPAGKGRSRSVIAARLAGTRSPRFGRVLRLDRGRPQPSGGEYAETRAGPRVAVTGHGTVVASWRRGACAFPCPSAAARRAGWPAGVVVRERRPGRRFGRTRMLAPGGTAAALDVSGDGSGLLAWLRPGGRQEQVLARTRTVAGTWGPAGSVATVQPYWSTEHVSADSGGGRFAVGVLQTLRRAGGVLVRASAHVRTPDVAPGWTEVRLADYLFTAAAGAPFAVVRLRVVVVVGDDGRVRAAWPQPVDGVMRAMVAEVAPTRSLPVPVSAAGASAIVNDAAAGPGGAFAVTWFDLGGRGSVNLAEGGSDGALRLSPPVGEAPGLLGARVAYSPRTGRPTVLWTQGAHPLGIQPMVWTSPAAG